MRLQIWTPCLLLLAVSAGAAALHTAVPPDEPTPEAQELPLKRTIPWSLVDGLSALWQGSGATAGPLSDSATIAAAAAGTEHPPVASSLSTSQKAALLRAKYVAQIRQLHRTSSDSAKAAWADAQSRGSDAGRYSLAQWRLLGAWWKAEEIDLLRDPWTSLGKITRGSWRQTKAGAREFWAIFGPGGRLHPTALFESQGHLAIEAALLVVLFVLLSQRAYRPGTAKLAERLTDKEIDELCNEWQPEPLEGGGVPPARQRLQPPVISDDVGTHVTANGRRVLNLASTNFLGIAGDPDIREICRKTIKKYGVGACGPRGFYGTIDVHLELEDRLAEFMGTEEAILYSYDLSTVPSILPAFANKRDLIICDEACTFPVQNGVMLSRARALYFKHNDVADLERVLQKVADEDRRQKRKLNRRFIVVEGIYANTGDVAPLAAIAALKWKYKYRLVVDESLSLGVLGANGRGAAEAAGLAPKDVDIISAALSNSFASIGGFCAGSREIVDHQRLSGLGYCFSAALPPYLATAATGAIDKFLREGAQLAPACTANACRMRGLLQNVPGLQLVGSEADLESPQIHLRLAQPRASHDDSEQALVDIAAEALRRDGVLLAVHFLAANDRCAAKGPSPLPPSLRVSVTAAHGAADLEKAAAVLRSAAQRVLGLKPSPSKRLDLQPQTSATL